MFVVCKDAARTSNLTVGKVYEVQPPQNGYVLSDTLYVINDAGNVGGYYAWRFEEQKG